MIECEELQAKFFGMNRLNAAFISGTIELLKPGMPEALNHL
jgi:hypothetical protein